MSRFKNITVQPNVLAGQAAIRGLNISVSEIVQHIISGKSVSEVLSLYPDLEQEDIFQSMAYAIGDLLHSINTWRFQAMKSLNNAQEYEELLFNPDLNNRYTLSNTQKEQFSKAIIEETENVEDAWYYLREWANINYVPKLLWQSKNLAVVVEKVLEHNQQRTNIIVDVEIPSEIPSVRANTYLEDCLYHLIADDSNIPTGDTILKISPQSSSEIGVIVQRQIDINNLKNRDVLIPSGSPLSMAAIIIYQHTGQMTCELNSDGVVFSFTLPIWQETSAM